MCMIYIDTGDLSIYIMYIFIYIKCVYIYIIFCVCLTHHTSISRGGMRGVHLNATRASWSGLCMSTRKGLMCAARRRPAGGRGAGLFIFLWFLYTTTAATYTARFLCFSSFLLLFNIIFLPLPHSFGILFLSFFCGMRCWVYYVVGNFPEITLRAPVFFFSFK